MEASCHAFIQLASYPIKRSFSIQTFGLRCSSNWKNMPDPVFYSRESMSTSTQALTSPASHQEAKTLVDPKASRSDCWIPRIAESQSVTSVFWERSWRISMLRFDTKRHFWEIAWIRQFSKGTELSQLSDTHFGPKGRLSRGLRRVKWTARKDIRC